MKNKYWLILIFVFIFSNIFELSSCSILRPFGPYNRGDLPATYTKISDPCFANILDALKEKDKNKMRVLFSKEALKKAIDFNGCFDYLNKLH